MLSFDSSHTVEVSIRPHQHFRATCHHTLMQWCVPVCALAVTLVLMDFVSLVLLLSQFVEECKCKLHNHTYNVDCGQRQVAAPAAAVDDDA